MNNDLLFMLSEIEGMLTGQPKLVVKACLKRLNDGMNESYIRISGALNRNENSEAFNNELISLMNDDNIEMYVSQIRESLKRSSELDIKLGVHGFKRLVKKYFLNSIKLVKKSNLKAYKQMKLIWSLV